MRNFNFYSAPLAKWELRKNYDRSGKVLNKYYQNSYQRATVSATYLEKDKKLSFGVALCSKSDNFVRSEGRTTATTRSISNPHLVIDLQTDDLREINKIFIETARQIVSDLNLPCKHYRQKIVVEQTIEE